MKRQFSHLTLDDRRHIESWRHMKVSPDEMARRLGRHRSTIFRELRRNHYHDVDTTSLNHAFQRWFGLSSTAYRKNLRRQKQSEG